MTRISAVQQTSLSRSEIKNRCGVSELRFALIREPYIICNRPLLSAVRLRGEFREIAIVSDRPRSTKEMVGQPDQLGIERDVEVRCGF